MSYTLSLYYKSKAVYSKEVTYLKNVLKKISDKWKTSIEIIELEKISEHDSDQIKMELRNIQPQVRGRIVTAKGMILPLSKGKNLNLENTPILGVLSEGKFVDVYPHLLGTHYYDIKTFLEDILISGEKKYFHTKGLLEEPIVKILSENPLLLGEGMIHVGTEVDVGAGKPDIIFKDINKKIVIVEVETDADDFAVGQVCRGATGYAEKYGLDSNDIRKAIVYQSAKNTLKAAALSAGVELYKLEFSRIV